MSEPDNQLPPEMAAVHGQTQVVALLQRIADREQHALTAVGVTSGSRRILEVKNVAGIPGWRRVIIARDGLGGSIPLVAGAPQLVCQHDEARLGGLVVNSGANGVTLYLGPAGKIGNMALPQTYLLPGGSWDFRLGTILWLGEVQAVADVGGSSLSWGVV